MILSKCVKQAKPIKRRLDEINRRIDIYKKEHDDIDD